MTIAHEFRYQRPVSLDEAFDLLAGGNGEAMVLAGGTDLVPWLRDEAVAPDLVVDIKGITGLDQIEDLGSVVSIGALVTFSDLTASSLVRERLPLLHEAAGTVGSVGIRNRATLAGNICSAVPSADSAPALLAFDAEVETTGKDGVRRIRMRDWFLGPRRTALGHTEIVTRVLVPVPAGAHGAAYARLSRYRGEDLAQASVAILITPGHTYRIAFGAVASTPIRAPRIESLLSGSPLDDQLADAAVSLVREEISPISDIRASREYRLHMCEVMLRRGLEAAGARLTGAGPAYGERLV